MNYQASFEGLRQNAASGCVWLCSRKQAGAVAGLLDNMIDRILRGKMGFTPAKQWIRDTIRLPFLNWLYEGAVYIGEPFTHERTKPIVSARELTDGEAHAILQWLGLDTAKDDLWGWINDSGIDIWRSERLV